jgi:ABC-type Fe3+/spermidine/putrescine transport system ATPase subunit
VMNQGRIEQDGSPEEVYYQPATPFVAQFLGFTNLLFGQVRADNQVETALGIWPIPAASQYPPGTAVIVLIRPEAASLDSNSGIAIEGELIASLFRGRFYQITVSVAGQLLTFELSEAMPYQLEHPQAGKSTLNLTKIVAPLDRTINLWLDPAAITLFAVE